jgi:hypothetical protein
MIKMIKTSYPTIILLLHLKNNTYKERFEHPDGTLAVGSYQVEAATAGGFPEGLKLDN